MRETWRWFGPQDEISIAEIRQTGASGIVSALHHRPPGAVWEIEDIQKRQAEIERPKGRDTGLTWDVVESLPVSEAIKTQSADMADHIKAYKQSLGNLAACGLKVICYNFMPILDWTRTMLANRLPNGGTSMLFDLTDFAAFDIHILRRPDAAEDFSTNLQDAARDRFLAMSDDAKTALVKNIVAGLPGAAEAWTLQDVRACLATYKGITESVLRQNLVDFLAEVVPTAEHLGLQLCCHPDDPPFSLLGLPRIVSNAEHYAQLVTSVESPANGITFCTGSLGVASSFDPVAFIRQLGAKIHFAHLRNTTRLGDADGEKTSFFEDEHLGGDTDMVATIQALISEETRRKEEGRLDWNIPMRADHGQSILCDLDRPVMPGYPLVGRLKGLAELRGVVASCS